jgi:hypothetical protein
MRIEMVDVTRIKFDPAYQRPLDLNRVSRIAKNFKEGAAKAVSLSERANGDLFNYDGNHTVHACISIGMTYVPAVIVSGSQAQEAEWFNAIQEGSKRLMVRDRQRAGVMFNDEIACRAKNVLDKYGLQISTGSTHAHKTGAIGAIRTYAKQDYPSLILAMDAIQSLWIDDECAWTGVVIRGMYEIAKSGKINDVLKMAKTKKITPRRILDTAAAMQESKGTSGSGAGAAKRAIYKLCGIEK